MSTFPGEFHFEGTPLSGPVPLTVTFTNTSTGDFDQALWNFGDGSTSTKISPTHVYTMPGSFTVTLVLSGLGGTDSITRTDYITVYEPPTAVFTALPTSGQAPLAVNFFNASSGDFETCLWDFGDGFMSNDCDDPSHIFEEPGTYTPSLTISGSGGTDVYTIPDYISVENYQVFLPAVVNASQSATAGNQADGVLNQEMVQWFILLGFSFILSRRRRWKIE
jgi:PKD repeat protein